MERSLITVTEYCRYHQDIEPSFVQALASGGLITFDLVEEEAAISYEQLPVLERYLRLHYDLDINLEGIEAIGHLLQRMEAMQRELADLRSRLTFYAGGADQRQPLAD